MTTAEVLLQDYDIELASTRRTLERVPDSKDKSEYKPHDKSFTFGRLAVHVSELPKFGTTILTTPLLDMAATKWPERIFVSREKLLSDFDAFAAEARAALIGASDADLAQSWQLRFGEKVIVDNPRSLAFRHMFFNHMIHHRAQLGVYLRLNDIPVPGVYGPSADEPFKP
jgi:uncharacterized damage-inducible protein DinB